MVAVELGLRLPGPAIPLNEREVSSSVGVVETHPVVQDGRMNSVSWSPRMVTGEVNSSSPDRPGNPSPSHEVSTGKSPKKHHTEGYVHSPFTMVGMFLFGLAMAASHHFYYHSLHGDLVGNMDDQQTALRLGTTFAYLTQVSLIMSVGIAYTQVFYKTLRALREKSEKERLERQRLERLEEERLESERLESERLESERLESERVESEELMNDESPQEKPKIKEKGVSMAAIDAGMAADQTIMALMNLEFLQKVKIGALVAIIAWLLQLPGLITPATLSVSPGLSTNYTLALVPSLNITNVNSSGTYQPKRFAYWVNATGSVDPAIQPVLLLGPRTIISRLSAATATSGRILPIIPPFVNSTYDLQFYGPKVKCSEANSTVSSIIDKFVKIEMANSPPTAKEVSNAYFAFVPDLSLIPDGQTIESTGGSNIPPPVLTNRMQMPTNGSNEVWMTFKRYANGSTCETLISPQLPLFLESRYLSCRLHNASYHINLKFVEGNQTVTDIDTKFLEEVPFPKVDPQVSPNLMQYAYSGIMWAFTDQFIGSMGFYTVNSSELGAASNFSEITTSIQHTSLLGSSDLDVFFDQNHGIVAAVNCTSSDQRTQDIDLAGNRTLDVLIEELSFNTTISFMTNTLLSPFINTTVKMDTSVNLYDYHPRNLLLAYGLAIFSVLIVNILGGMAFKTNGVSYDRQFSSILSATRDPTLKDIFPPQSLGKLPVPYDVKRTLLVFGKLNKGMKNVFGKEEEEGWGFMQVGGEVKERRGSRYLSI